MSGGNLFVAGHHGLAPSATNGTVGEYNVSTTVINASFLTGLKGPTGIVVSGADLSSRATSFNPRLATRKLLRTREFIPWPPRAMARLVNTLPA